MAGRRQGRYRLSAGGGRSGRLHCSQPTKYMYYSPSLYLRECCNNYAWVCWCCNQNLCTAVYTAIPEKSLKLYSNVHRNSEIIVLVS